MTMQLAMMIFPSPLFVSDSVEPVIRARFFVEFDNPRPQHRLAIANHPQWACRLGGIQGCRMNPIAEKTPDILISEEAPTARAVAAMKPPAKTSRRQRKSCRRIVPVARQSCELKAGGKVLSASLVNESQGGFAVWTDSVDCLKTGEKVRLNTDQGWVTVRVVYVREVAKSQDASPKCDAWFQLGFKKAGGFLCFLDAETLLRKGKIKAVETEMAEKRPIRTKRKIEAAIAEEISHFEQEYMGQEPKHIYVCLIEDILVVRLRSVLAEANRQLAKLLPAEKRSGLLKEVRSQLIRTIRPVIEVMVEKITGVNVVTTQHDINTTNGEEVFVFSLAQSPDFLK
jgi:uncharacterized protein YbcI